MLSEWLNSKHSSWLPNQGITFAGTQLFNLTASFGLTQVVSDPTLTTNSGKDVLLDLIFVNDPTVLRNVLPFLRSPTIALLFLLSAYHVEQPQC